LTHQPLLSVPLSPPLSVYFFHVPGCVFPLHPFLCDLACILSFSPSASAVPSLVFFLSQQNVQIIHDDSLILQLVGFLQLLLSSFFFNIIFYTDFSLGALHPSNGSLGPPPSGYLFSSRSSKTVSCLLLPNPFYRLVFLFLLLFLFFLSGPSPPFFAQSCCPLDFPSPPKISIIAPVTPIIMPLSASFLPFRL